MARGGRRTGAPGQTFGNRTDMNQPVKVVSGEPYGSRQALENAQKAVPLPNNQAVPAPAATPGPAATTPQAGPGPPALPGQQDFMRPTERPDEPVTAGLPSGPGPGPEVLNAQPQPDLIGAQLRAVYQAFPNDDLLRVLALHAQQQ